MGIALMIKIKIIKMKNYKSSLCNDFLSRAFICYVRINFSGQRNLLLKCREIIKLFKFYLIKFYF